MVFRLSVGASKAEEQADDLPIFVGKTFNMRSMLIRQVSVPEQDQIVHAIVFHEDLGDIQRSERCVERKVQLSLVSCLTIHKSRELLAVVIEELYLETSAVCLSSFPSSRT